MRTLQLESSCTRRLPRGPTYVRVKTRKTTRGQRELTHLQVYAKKYINIFHFLFPVCFPFCIFRFPFPVLRRFTLSRFPFCVSRFSFPVSFEDLSLPYLYTYTELGVGGGARHYMRVRILVTITLSSPKSLKIYLCITNWKN